MGLDVYAISAPTLVRARRPHEEAETDDFWEEGDQPGRVYLYDNPDFPGRSGGLVSGIYAAERLGDWRSPAHVCTSYTGHNDFREWLCLLVHGVKPEVIWRDIVEGRRKDEGRFIELINFADNDGTLGVEVCKKLLDDFDAYAENVHHDCIANGGESTDYALHYERWRAMLRLAVEAGGVLKFA